MVPESGMRMAVGAAPVANLISRRPDPKGCGHTLGNRILFGKLCGLCGKVPV